MPDGLRDTLTLIACAAAGWGFGPYVFRWLDSLFPRRHKEPPMPADPAVLTLARSLVLGVVAALLDDGRIDAEEAGELREELLDALADLGQGISVTDAAGWVASRVQAALTRDPARMRERAARLYARGKIERAARLRERAARVEGRR